MLTHSQRNGTTRISSCRKIQRGSGSQKGPDGLPSKNDFSEEDNRKESRKSKSPLKRMFWAVNHSQSQASLFVSKCFHKANSQRGDQNSEIITGIIPGTRNFPVRPCKNTYVNSKESKNRKSSLRTPPKSTMITLCFFFFYSMGEKCMGTGTQPAFPK